MGKKALTLDLQTGKKKLETIIEDLNTAAGRDDVAYSAKAVDEKVDAISETITSAVESVAYAASYQNPVSGIYETEEKAVLAGAKDQSRYAIGNQIEVYTAAKSAVGNPGDANYEPEVLESWTIVAKISDGAKVVNYKTLQEYMYDSSIGKNGYNNTSWKKFLEDKTLVHTIGSETISGTKTFSNNATFEKDVLINGDLSVEGTLTTINTQDLTIKDNIILLNDGDPGLASNGGITSGVAGIEINRGGTLPKAQLLFTNATEGFQAGVEGDLKTVAVIDDAVSSSSKETYSIDKINSLINNVTAGVSNITIFTYIAEEDLDAGQIVYVTTNGKIAIATSTDDSCVDKIAGIVMQGVLAGEEAQVAKFGRISKFNGLTTGSAYFLGEDGYATNTCPSNNGNIICKLGVATDDLTLLLQIEECIVIA